MNGRPGILNTVFTSREVEVILYALGNRQSANKGRLSKTIGTKERARLERERLELAEIVTKLVKHSDA